MMLKLKENITWMAAFFHSVSARTAGFSTYPLGTFSQSGLLVLTVFMFIGASPGSTGGGIKTSTFFVLLPGIKSAATNRDEKTFRYAIPKNAFRKASVIATLAVGVVIVGTYLMKFMEPDIPMADLLFEINIMYIGRLGPLTIASLWYFTRGDRVSYPEGNIAIG